MDVDDLLDILEDAIAVDSVQSRAEAHIIDAAAARSDALRLCMAGFPHFEVAAARLHLSWPLLLPLLAVLWVRLGSLDK